MKLPLANPIVDVVPGYAASLSVILQHENGMKWFIENYMDICCLYDADKNVICCDYQVLNHIPIMSHYHIGVDSIYCPALETYVIPRELLKNNGIDIITFIQQMISEGRYLFLYLNRKYIKEFDYKVDFSHVSFVYGYDHTQELIYIADYFNNAPYRLSACSYAEFICSYNGVCQTDIYINGAFHHICTTNAIYASSYSSTFHYSLDMGSLSKNIQTYLNPSQNPHIPFTIFNYDNGKCLDTYAGIDFYKSLIIHAKESVQRKEKFDLRAISFFHNHKTMLKHKFEYLLSNGYISSYLRQEVDRVIDDILVFRNIAIKANLVNTMSDLQLSKIEGILLACMEKEKVILSDVYYSLIQRIDEVGRS